MKTYLESIAVAIGFGFLFTWLHMPMPWMLGPIAGMVCWNTLFKRPVKAAKSMRDGGLIFLGYLIGSSFTLEAGGEILRQLPWMTLSTVLMVFISLFLGWMMAHWMKINLPTAIIGTIPGGLSQMAVLAEEVKGADPGTITLMQTIRVLTVIFVVPFLALHTLSSGSGRAAAGEMSGLPPDMLSSWQWFVLVLSVLISPWLAGKLRIPTPFFLGPVIATIVYVFVGWHPPHLPDLWVNVAQVAVGTHLGTTIQLSHLHNWKNLLSRSLIGSLLTISISLFISFLLVTSLPLSFLTAFLSTSPGGMAEMGVTAAITGGDIAVVSAYQMFRILFILFLVPPFIKWLLNRRVQKSRSG